jgi:hypothetical protein
MTLRVVLPVLLVASAATGGLALHSLSAGGSARAPQPPPKRYVATVRVPAALSQAQVRRACQVLVRGGSAPDAAAAVADPRLSLADAQADIGTLVIGQGCGSAAVTGRQPAPVGKGGVSYGVAPGAIVAR